MFIAAPVAWIVLALGTWLAGPSRPGTETEPLSPPSRMAFTCLAAAEASAPCAPSVEYEAKAVPAPMPRIGSARRSGPVARRPTRASIVFFTVAAVQRDDGADQTTEVGRGAGVSGHAASQRLLGARRRRGADFSCKAVGTAPMCIRLSAARVRGVGSSRTPVPGHARQPAALVISGNAQGPPHGTRG